MNRAFVLCVAAFAAIVGFALVGDSNSANAGHHRKGCSGCSCSTDCCSATPDCCSTSCCSSDCCHGRVGLLARLKAKHAKKHCCHTDCCSAAPACCAASACCGGAAMEAPAAPAPAAATPPAPAPAPEGKTGSLKSGFGFRAVSFRN